MIAQLCAKSYNKAQWWPREGGTVIECAWRWQSSERLPRGGRPCVGSSEMKQSWNAAVSRVDHHWVFSLDK